MCKQFERSIIAWWTVGILVAIFIFTSPPPTHPASHKREQSLCETWHPWWLWCPLLPYGHPYPDFGTHVILVREAVIYVLADFVR